MFERFCNTLHIFLNIIAMILVNRILYYFLQYGSFVISIFLETNFKNMHQIFFCYVNIDYFSIVRERKTQFNHITFL